MTYFVHRERRAAFLRALKIADHAGAVRRGLESQVDAGVLAGVEHVIALILRVRHSESVTDILRQRVHLKREIAALHRVQKIEPDGEFGAEAGVHCFAEQFARMLIDQVDGGQLQTNTVKVEQQAVLFRHAIETPGVVGWSVGKAALAPHPLAAPRSGIEERNHPERAPRSLTQSPADCLAARHLRHARVIRVEQIIYGIEQGALDPVRHAPVEEVGALIFERRPFSQVLRAEVADKSGALP